MSVLLLGEIPQVSKRAEGQTMKGYGSILGIGTRRKWGKKEKRKRNDKWGKEREEGREGRRGEQDATCEANTIKTQRGTNTCAA